MPVDLYRRVNGVQVEVPKPKVQSGGRMLELLWNAPMCEAKMSNAFESLELRPGQSVLDVGCGCGEALIRLHERFRIKGLGVDLSHDQIREAERRAESRVERTLVRFIQADAETLEIEPGSVDVALCLGASHAFGLGKDAYPAALERLLHWVAPGGRLLVAEGYLKRPAPPEYRAVIGDFPADDRTHAANVFIGSGLGLVPLAAWTSSVDEWDHFEWTYQRIVERRAAERPLDPEAAAKLNRRREWMAAYLQEGRETLGYGTYLFQRPKG
jgi:SAM-dependent methyltransferase